MDTFLVASSNAAASGVSSDSKGSDKKPDGALGAQFMEILSKARMDVQGGLGLAASRSTMPAMPERAPTEAPRNDPQDDRREPERDASPAQDRDDDYGRDRSEAARDSRADQRDQDAAADRRDDRNEPRSDQHADDGNRNSHDDARDDNAASRSDANEPKQADASSDKADSGDDAGPAQAADTGNRDAATDGQAANEAATAKAAEGLANAHQEDPTLAAIAALANVGAQTNKVDPTQQNAAAGPVDQGEVKAEGPARPDGHIGQQWKTAAQDPARLPTQAQNAAQNGQAQAQAQADPLAQAKLDAAFDPAKSGAQRQAAELSQMVGQGNRISVQTEVTDESKTLVSRPTANLANTSILAGDGSKQTQSTAQSGQVQGPLGGLHLGAQQAAQQANLGAGGAQQGSQAAAQAAQQAVSGANGLEAKGPMQAAGQAGAMGQNAQGLGAEGQTTPHSTAGTASNAGTQQSQTAQNATQPRFTLPGQAVTDQVNVQITKALENGLDKIEIHLKPANLGRVDVRMELSHDGRVQAVVTADNKDTLDLLQKDARELERALQDAGLQADSGSLSFGLRERHADGGGRGNGNGNGWNGDDGDLTADADDGLADAASPYSGGIISDDRVDIRA